MTYQIDITEDALSKQVRVFLLSAFAPGVEVVRLFQNRVSMPKGPYIGFFLQAASALATNINTFRPDDGEQSSTQHKKLGVQIDFYGPAAADQAAIFAALWMDETTCEFFAGQTPFILQPLENADPLQMPLVDGEQQYQMRWVVKAFLQYNGSVSLTQDYFTGADVVLQEVDAVYPPNEGSP